MPKTRIVGYVLCCLVAALLLGVSVPPKLTATGPNEMSEHIGYPWQTMRTIGVVELVIALLLVAPRTGIWGALLITAYLGGATASHVRVGDPAGQFLFPVILACVMWVGVLLRMPGLAPLLVGHALDPRVATRGEAQSA